jgi:two-component system chemotaxis sensor kinase CheA
MSDVFRWNSEEPDEKGQEPGQHSGLNNDTADVVVLQVAGRAAGLPVDELIGNQDIVVKSLSDNFINIAGLSGASILGDGRVCLMLDVSTLFRIALTGIRTGSMEESVK